MEPFLYYPVKDPINQSNLFGANPTEYKPLGQAGHPGNDFESVTGTKIYSPVSGSAFYVKDSLGGDGIWIRTAQNGQNYVIILWHMPVVQPVGTGVIPGVATSAQYPFQIPTNGAGVLVTTGQFLGYTDNSGYGKESTGPHLHLGVMPVDANWNTLYPTNGFLGCIDPKPFYNGQFAEDIDNPPPTPTPQTIEEASEVVRTIASSSLPATTKENFLAELLSLLKQYL